MSRQCGDCSCSKTSEPVTTGSSAQYIVELLVVDIEFPSVDREVVPRVFKSISEIRDFADAVVIPAGVREGYTLATTELLATEDAEDELNALGVYGARLLEHIPKGTTALMPMLHINLDTQYISLASILVIYEAKQ